VVAFLGCSITFNPSMKETLDVVIIGGGPIGLATGIECKKNGLTYVILEKGVLVNSLYNYPQNMTFFSTSDKLEIGDVPFISHNTKPTRSEALEYYRRVTSAWKLNVHTYEGVERVEKENGHFTVFSERSAYTARCVVLTTGFYDAPHKLGIPGEELPKVFHYYKDPHPFFGKKIVVIGAANSAVDVALETWRKGASEVRMIVREPEISPRAKYWVRPDLINRIEEGSIPAHFNAELVEIKEKSVIFREADGALQEIENDFVLAMTGYEPNFKLLRSLGVGIKDDETQAPIYNEETMETDESGVFVAGVVCGGLETHKWFIENSRVHGKRIASELARRKSL
jgi:thioredoxin reductase (NADPH)